MTKKLQEIKERLADSVYCRSDIEDLLARIEKMEEVVKVQQDALALIERAYATHGERMAHQNFAQETIQRADRLLAEIEEG